MRVLVINSEEKTREAARKALADMGIFNVKEVATAKVGRTETVVANATTRPFDLIMAEANCPVARELLKMCQTTDSFKSIKFIFVMPENTQMIDNESTEIEGVPCIVGVPSFNKVRNRMKRLEFSVPKYKVAA